MSCMSLPEYKVLIIDKDGQNSRRIADFLKEKGFDAFLMGEYFMKNENPGNKFKEFVDVII